MLLAKWLKQAEHAVIFTGAGMSTESGLPDFRTENQGLWKQENPEKIASIDALNKNVENFFEFYRKRVRGVQTLSPHQGHFILSKWEKQGLIKRIITQNVDGFHQQAGSKHVSELHGTLQKVHCQTCKREFGSERYMQEEYICDCGGKLRPSVVLFGEMLPEEPFITAEQASRQADLFIVLGSSLSVTPANQFPLIAKDNGAKLVIVNLEPTPFDMYADLVINDQKIGEILAELDQH